MKLTRQVERIINACHSMTDCDLQRSWDLLHFRAEWQLERKTSIAKHFVEALNFYAERYDGQFIWW
jgi:arginine decarboxylase-like protein